MSNKLVPLSSRQHTAIEKSAPLHRGTVLSSLLDNHEPNSSCALLDAALTSVAQKGLGASGFEAVKSAALGVWHGNHVPAESVFRGTFALDAALLVERLAFYAIVSQSRKKDLLCVVRPLLPTAGSPSRAAFNVEFKRYLPALQPLQTRHYRFD